MKVTISGKHIELTEGLKTRVDKAMAKLDRYFTKDTEAFVTLSVLRENQTVEATIRSGGILLRVEERSPDMYMSIDNAVDVLERQLRKHKTRLEKKLKRQIFDAEPLQAQYGSVEEEKEFNIVRTKRFDYKPMSTEEAILEMNLLGHTFFVYHNANTDEPNVVYKRKDGNYGLIELGD